MGFKISIQNRDFPISHCLQCNLYLCSVLHSFITNHVRHLQSVLNAAARLIYHLRPHDHISDALATQYWLRVQYKIAVLTFKMLHDSATRYLGPQSCR